MVSTGDGKTPDAGPHYFELNVLVDVFKVGGMTQTAIVDHEDGAKLPANACVGPPKLRAV
jgi:hypothetical protein